MRLQRTSVYCWMQKFHKHPGTKDTPWIRRAAASFSLAALCCVCGCGCGCDYVVCIVLRVFGTFLLICVILFTFFFFFAPFRLRIFKLFHLHCNCILLLAIVFVCVACTLWKFSAKLVDLLIEFFCFYAIISALLDIDEIFVNCACNSQQVYIFCFVLILYTIFLSANVCWILKKVDVFF